MLPSLKVRSRSPEARVGEVARVPLHETGSARQVKATLISQDRRCRAVRKEQQKVEKKV